jgi:cyclophilin family peptidyl-prolyl cis-trans isomerase
MKKHDRWLKRKTDRRPARLAALPAASANAVKTGESRERLGWLVAGVLVAALVATLVYKWWPTRSTDAGDIPVAKAAGSLPTDFQDPPVNDTDAPHGHVPKIANNAEESHGNTSKAKPDAKGLPDNFLDAFNDKDGASEKETDVKSLSNPDLEKRFQALTEISERLNALKKQVATPGALSTEAQFKQALVKRDRLLDDYNRTADSLQKTVAQARLARPKDAVPRWLAGELLMLVGGEPEEYSPHLKYAIAQGLDRPRLQASVALAHLQANEFAAAYKTAADALKRYNQDRYLWQAFARIAFCTNHFDEVIRQLDQAFPAGEPGWAKAHRAAAAAMLARWDVEQKLRAADALANNLPRVRLVIEHRQFGKGKDAAGQSIASVESVGPREEVVLELFEDQAPNTVANFLDLVTRKFYDGTSFHLALPATIVAGGDPLTKNSDPSDDGAGGPGYVIADECKSPAARSHFRGSLSMVNTGPRTAGSQFFLSLAPSPEMNGTFTVFGRVIQGQDAVDRITRGRTTRVLGHYGKIIPGDLLVRAEIIRKRDHEYKVLKLQP